MKVRAIEPVWWKPKWGRHLPIWQMLEKETLEFILKIREGMDDQVHRQITERVRDPIQANILEDLP